MIAWLVALGLVVLVAAYWLAKVPIVAIGPVGLGERARLVFWLVAGAVVVVIGLLR